MNEFMYITTVFIFIAAIIDLYTRRVPLWLTLPAMAGAVVYQLSVGGNIIGLMIAWVVAFLLWKLKFYGGGDAKVLMGLFGFFPVISLAWVQAATALAVAIPWLIFKYRHHLKASAATAGAIVITGNILPNGRGYKTNGHPVVWVYALGWLVWLTGNL